MKLYAHNLFIKTSFPGPTVVKVVSVQALFCHQVVYHYTDKKQGHLVLPTPMQCWYYYSHNNIDPLFLSTLSYKKGRNKWPELKLNTVELFYSDCAIGEWNIIGIATLKFYCPWTFFQCSQMQGPKKNQLQVANSFSFTGNTNPQHRFVSASHSSYTRMRCVASSPIVTALGALFVRYHNDEWLTHQTETHLQYTEGETVFWMNNTWNTS